MSIVYDPSKVLKKVAPDKKIKRLLSKGMSLKRSALSFVDSFDFIDKKAITRIAMKTVKGYQERAAKAVVDSGMERSAGTEARSKIVDDPKQLIQRVQNEALFQVKEEIKSKYDGEMYEWLPSDAETPDPEHQLNYGKIFQVGVGEMPGDRYGCRCGMRILVDETELRLE